MKIDRKSLQLYLVTDRSWTGEESLIGQVEKSLENGTTFLQLREKNIGKDEFLKSAIEMKALAQKYNVPFVINDDVEIAKKSDANGVHIGQGDMPADEARKLIGPDKILGVSVRTVEQAIEAQKSGADYIGVGAIFTTNTKKDASGVSIYTLKDICSAVDIPVVAIGGITRDNISSLNGSGVDGVAVISAILAQKDIAGATRNLKTLCEGLKTGMKKVLTIAGSDCSGGAGIQADLKTIAAHKCYGMSVITALTAQNTTGVYGVEACSGDFVKNQMDCVFGDIFPDAVKIGMVSSVEIIEAIAQKLREYKPENVVIDPVMVATSGGKLLDDNAIEKLLGELMPLGTMITPNLLEAEILCGFKISSAQDMINAAEKISKKYSGSILIKGGHLEDNANDLLWTKGKAIWLEGEKIDNPNTHGTGCTLSSAIASNLAKGFGVEDSVRNAKTYITGALKDQMDIGRGSGPLNHCYNIRIGESN